jgi:hypothetical protein
MTGGTQENAMTEIALAMAMGFFSVMVLTAMSMGVSVPSAKSRTPAIATALVSDSSDRSAAAGATDKVTDQDILVVFDGVRFLGRDLNIIDPAKLDAGKRVVLAVTPDLSMAEAIRARKRISAKRLVLTTLDGDWRRALKERANGR